MRTNCQRRLDQRTPPMVTGPRASAVAILEVNQFVQHSSLGTTHASPTSPTLFAPFPRALKAAVSALLCTAGAHRGLDAASAATTKRGAGLVVEKRPGRHATFKNDCGTPYRHSNREKARAIVQASPYRHATGARLLYPLRN